MRHPRFEPSNLRKSFQSCKRKPLENKKFAIFGTFLRFLVVAPSKIPHFIATMKNKAKTAESILSDVSAAVCVGKR